LCLAREPAGMTLADLRRAVGAGNRMTVSAAIRRFHQRLDGEKRLRKLLAKIVEELRNRSRPTRNTSDSFQ